ncbi:hypothetical protein NDU88_005485 [Pleurodeles waltl]|uniref:Uncharacterized protein n=1 Tax=Pleurodeles waltl TaxID=8319 RepID=A0AAV7LXG1_PLEWA|nr:hypothetical protein NDU88_005485 [Pleurodeles waltl]
MECGAGNNGGIRGWDVEQLSRTPQIPRSGTAVGESFTRPAPGAGDAIGGGNSSMSQHYSIRQSKRVAFLFSKRCNRLH